MMKHKIAWITGSLILVASMGMFVSAFAEPEPFEPPTKFTAVIPMVDMNGLAQDNAVAVALQPPLALDSNLAQVAAAPKDLDTLMEKSGLALAGGITTSEVGHFHLALTISMAAGAGARGEDTHVRNFLKVIVDMAKTLGYPPAVLDRVKGFGDKGKFGDILELFTNQITNRNSALTIAWTLGFSCGAVIAGMIYELPPMLKVGRNSISEVLKILGETESNTPFAGLAKDLHELTSATPIDHDAVLKAITTRYEAMGFSN
ncbi:hypothetical protein KBA39_04965 [Myxococcota bacterium]|nr:hypothetical protein [Myxococcota bacterium]